MGGGSREDHAPYYAPRVCSGDVNHQDRHCPQNTEIFKLYCSEHVFAKFHDFFLSIAFILDFLFLTKEKKQ